MHWFPVGGTGGRYTHAHRLNRIDDRKRPYTLHTAQHELSHIIIDRLHLEAGILISDKHNRQIGPGFSVIKTHSVVVLTNT